MTGVKMLIVELCSLSDFTTTDTSPDAYRALSCFLATTRFRLVQTETRKVLYQNKSTMLGRVQICLAGQTRERSTRLKIVWLNEDNHVCYVMLLAVRSYVGEDV
ncbi:uncharacterized protein V6R79_017519 [Siganus canaliculatus]